VKDNRKIRAQLIDELAQLRQRISQLELGEAELKEAQAVLLPAAQQWRATFDAIADGVFLLDAEGKVARCNQTMAKRLQKSPNELIGHTCWELVDGTSEPPPSCPFVLARESRRRHTMLRAVDDRWYSSVVDPMVDEDGSFVGAVCSMADVTARKQAEDAVRESEERYRTLFEGIPDGVIVHSAEKGFLDCNEAVLRRLGYSREEFLRLRPADIVHPDFLSLTHESQGGMWAGERSTVESAHVCKDGRAIQVEVNARRIKHGGMPAILAVVRDIEERKRVQEELRETEERYRLLFESSPICLWEQDFSDVKRHLEDLRRSGVSDFRAYFRKHPEAVRECTSLVKLADVNRTTLDFYQAETKAELLRGLDQVFTEESYDVFMEELVSIAEGRTQFDGESSARTLGGERKDIALRWSVAPGFEETLARVVVSDVDITERKRAEEALRESEARFRQFFENQPAYCYMVSPERTLLDANRAALEALGYEKEELVGKPLDVIYAPESLPTVERLFRRWKETGELKDEETTIITKEGARRTVVLSANAVTDREGRILSSVSVQQDITERKREEEELRESEERYRTLFERTGNPILVIDKQGNYIDCNEAAAESLESGRDEILTMNVRDTLPPGGETQVMEQHLPVWDEGGTLETDYYVHGKIKTLELTITPASWHRKPAVFGVGTDITERKQAEQEIRQRNEELLALNAIAETLSSSLNLREILDSALSKVLEILAVEAGGIYLVDETSRRVTLMAHHGVSEEFVSQMGELAVDEETIARATEMGKAGKLILATELLLKDSTLLKAVTTAIAREKLRSYLQVIIRSKGTPAGLLVVASRDGREFTAREEQLLSTIAHQIGLVVENVSLYEEQVNKVFQMDALRKTTLDITSQLDLDVLLHSIASRAIQLLNGTAGGLYLYRPEQDVLEWAVAIGDAMAPVGTMLRPGEGLAGKVWETGQSLVVDDYRHWEGRAAVYEAYPLTAVVGAPVRWGTTVLGVLCVNALTPRAFSQADANLLGLFAGQAAIAIENARLFAEQKRRAREMTALYETSLDISGRLALIDVLRSIMNRGVELLHTAGGAVWLYRPGEDELELAVDYGTPETYVGGRMKVGEGVSGKVFADRQAMAVEDYRQWEGRSQKYDSDIIGGMLGVPLMWGEQAIGVLNINEIGKPRKFTEEEIHLLSLFANQAAVAIQNARLHEETRRREAQLAALHHVALEIASELDLTVLLKTVAQRAVELLGGPRGGLYLYRPERQELEMVVNLGWEHDHLGTTLRLGEGACGRAAQTGQPLLVVDYANWEGRSVKFEDEGNFNVLAVPIKHGDSLLGALHVDDPDLERRFDEADIRLATMFANQAAIAIENSRLHQEQHQRAQELAALHETALDITRHLDLDSLLAAVVARATGLLGAPSGDIYLYRPDLDDLESVASLGMPPELQGVTLKVGEGLSGKVFESGEPLAVEDYEAWDGRSAQYAGYGFSRELGAPLRSETRSVGVLVVDRPADAPRFTERDARLLTLFANQATIAIENAQLLHAVAKHKENLQGLSSRLIDAQEQERKRIAQELHDEMGQALTAMSINLSAINKQLGAALDPETAERLAETDTLITRTLEQMRELALDLRPSMLDDLGLLPALRWYVKRYENRTGILVGLEAVGLELRLPEHIETAMYRVVQEALTNVARHARASRVDVRLQRRDSIVQAFIEDDGSGFDPAEVADREAQGRGVGLVGMRERIAALGGSLEIESHPGKGTRLTIELPLP